MNAFTEYTWKSIQNALEKSFLMGKCNFCLHFNEWENGDFREVMDIEILRFLHILKGSNGPK